LAIFSIFVTAEILAILRCVSIEKTPPVSVYLTPILRFLSQTGLKFAVTGVIIDSGSAGVGAPARG
jgi:hypothetical protein